MVKEFKMGQYISPGNFKWETDFDFSIDNKDRKLYIEDSGTNQYIADLDKVWVKMKIYKKSNNYYYYGIMVTGTVGGNLSTKKYNDKDTPDYLPGTVNGILKLIGSDDIRVLKESVDPNNTFLQVAENTTFQMKMDTVTIGGVQERRIYVQF